jgi:uncharacterized cupin superfamily protein
MTASAVSHLGIKTAPKESVTVKKIDPAAASGHVGSSYPPPYDEPCNSRRRHRLGQAAGLTAFGVNRLILPPGAWSSQRHWHSHEDEFVCVLEGEVTLITEAGEEILRPGDCAGFKAGDPDGHHLVNRGAAEAVVLEIGSNDFEHDRCVYPDIDMVAEPGEDHYRRRDGTAYAKVER